MKTILLVEPDRATADIIAQYMRKNAPTIVVSHASTAQEAIHIADGHLPSLVVLELAIPEHNGLAFLHEFRSYNEWAHVPVIVHSHLSRQAAHLSAADLEQLGVTDYLYKPTTSLAKLNKAITT